MIADRYHFVVREDNGESGEEKWKLGGIPLKLHPFPRRRVL